MEEGEDFTAGVEADFMELLEEGFAGVEHSTEEAALVLAAQAPTADIAEAVTLGGGAITEPGEVTAGAAGATVGAEHMVMAVTDGAGELGMGGRIGVGDGGIRITTTTTRNITRPILIMRTRITGLRTIHRAIPILMAGTTTLRRQLRTHRPRPTRTGRQDPGDRRYREGQPIRTTQTTTSRGQRRAGQYSRLTG